VVDVHKHIMSNCIIVNAQEAGVIYSYKTSKEKLFKTNAAVWFSIYTHNMFIYIIHSAL